MNFRQNLQFENQEMHDIVNNVFVRVDRLGDILAMNLATVV